MSKFQVQVQKLPDGIDEAAVSANVEAYAEANPLVSSATVTVVAKGSDGADVQLEGSYTRSPLGQIVFMVLSEVGKEVLGAVVRGLRGRKEEKLQRRNERRVARGKQPLAPGEKTKAGKIIAATAQALFDKLTGEGLLKEIGPGVFSRAGGQTYAGREAVLTALQQELDAAPATRKTAVGRTVAKVAAKVAPKKVAKAAAKKAVKVAAKKVAKKK